MKEKKNSLIQAIKAIIIIFALTFSTNMHASTSLTFGSWWSRFWARITTHTHYNGCGHSVTGGGGSQGGGDTIPLDGGLGILLLGAAAFGVKKLRESKNEKI